MSHTPFGPRFMRYSAHDLLTFYDQKQSDAFREAELARLGAPVTRDEYDQLEKIVLRGIVLARLEGTPAPSFAAGDRLKCTKTASPDRDRWQHELMESDTFLPGSLVNVFDFTFLPGKGWFISVENRSSFMFYPADHFENVIAVEPVLRLHTTTPA
ncbi:MAG: hypothetical protein JWN50_330 [Parcubacteria group bacterium]|nr:hypothetical protein [Parcubacteria group bacterium]